MGSATEDSGLFAHTASGLLARKGGARPALRPQAWADDASAPQSQDRAEFRDAAPANDEAALDTSQHLPSRHLRGRISAGFAAAVAQYAPVANAELTPVATHPAPARKRSRRRALDRGGKAAFTLRIDAERHALLRQTCLAANRSAQQVLIEALDRLIADYSPIDTLSGQTGPAFGTKA